MKLARPVFLIGFMGAGKSSVARKLARLCGIASVDVDAYIERSQGRSIADIFATDGEEAFRQIEAETLAELAAGDPMVVSCGGGAPTTPAVRELLASEGYVIYLQVDPDEARRRIDDAGSRPLFTDDASVRARWEARNPVYESVADAAVQTKDRSLYAIVDEVRDILMREGVLWR